MGLQDRDWYAEDFKRRQALSDKPSKPTLKRSLNRKVSHDASPIKTGIYTVLALAIFTVLLRYILKH
jgi:hypothetical protein